MSIKNLNKDEIKEQALKAITDTMVNKADKTATIIAETAELTYVAHRYLNSHTGLPTTTTSNSFNLYKVDVSECDIVNVQTTRSSTGSNLMPVLSFTSSSFENVTVNSEVAANIVGIGKIYSATSDIISETVEVPSDAKTMFVIALSSTSAYPIVTEYKYGYFQDLKKVPQILDDVTNLKSTTNGLIMYSNSPYYRTVRWGAGVLDDYYHSEDNGVSLFTSETTAADYFTMFNTLVAPYTGYAESHQMGLASDGITMMYYYTLNPLTNQDGENYKRPKIIITAGQHGFEKTANFGVYWFIKNLLEDWKTNKSLDYIRNHVQLIVIPMLNPYGFDNDKYVNANGVNLNRNWDTQSWSQGTQGTTTYGGPAPFSELETQYARDVILNNLDALWLCDYHNNGQTAPNSAAGYLWHSFALVTYDDPYFTKAINAAKYHIEDTTGHLYADYPDQCQYANSGTFTDDNAPSHQGLVVAYAREHNIMAATMEGAAAFIGYGSRYSSSIHHMNADLLGNWIRSLISTFSKLEQ